MTADRGIMLARQADAFRVGMRDTGLTFKQVAHRLGQGESTVRSWARGAAEMPLHALGPFARCFPGEAVDLLLDDGLALVAVPEGADHAEFAGRCLDWFNAYTAARHPESEAGSDLGEGEVAQLNRRRAGLG